MLIYGLDANEQKRNEANPTYYRPGNLGKPFGLFLGSYAMDSIGQIVKNNVLIGIKAIR
ncbi:hypothetical protein GCM10027185_62360 [Spirosoma pulveris]